MTTISDLTPAPDEDGEVDLDTLECRCEKPDDQYLMEIDSSSLSLVHAACGRPAASWTDDALFMERIPVTMTWSAITDHWAGDVDAWGDLTINAGAAQEQALATIERLRNQVYGLAHRRPSAQRCTACGHTGIVHDLPAPRGCMGHTGTCPCPGWAAPCTYPDGPCVCPGTEDTGPDTAPADSGDPEIVVLCGSMRYADDMAAVAWQQSLLGRHVLRPDAPPAGVDGWAAARAAGVDLTAQHYTKIRRAHRVLVVGRHVGDHTRGEIEFARSLGKPVEFTDADAAREFGGEVWKPETAPTA